MHRDGLADLNENWAEWLGFTAAHAVGGASHAFGAIRCSSVGVPMPLFNQAFVFDEPDPEDLAQATRWLSKRQVPFWVSAPDHVAPSVAALGARVGLDPAAATMPGMTFSPLAEMSTAGSEGIEIVPVSQSAQLEEFAIVASEAFGAPPQAAAALVPATTLEDDRCAWFLGYVEGDLAACGQLFRTDHVAGVYSIGVRESFRHRGLGAAITSAVLAGGRDAGCGIGVLQASPMGAPVYVRMGFDTITQYHSFAPSDPGG